MIFQNSPKYLGSFEISRASNYPKYPKETVLFLVYTARQRNFAHYVAGVIFTCKCFKFGLNTTDLIIIIISQSHFRNLSACSIIFIDIMIRSFLSIKLNLLTKSPNALDGKLVFKFEWLIHLHSAKQRTLGRKESCYYRAVLRWLSKN